MGRLTFWHDDRLVERLMKAERQGMLQYACYRLGNLDDAEDVVQDVFVRFCQLQSEGGTEIKNRLHLNEVKNPSAYLFRMLANLCTSRQREAGRFATVPLTGQPEPANPQPEDFEWEYRHINQLLLDIPEEQTEIIRLRFYGDKSFREIADILGLPLTTVKSRFAYGMEKVRRGMLASRSV